jgi:hypothetical protein
MFMLVEVGRIHDHVGTPDTVVVSQMISDALRHGDDRIGSFDANLLQFSALSHGRFRILSIAMHL